MRERKDKKSLISIITVVRNNRKSLESTIKSVLTQQNVDIEYIVIDGGSQDGTLEIIEKQQANIDYWVSEKDSGIYDAMNKGIRAASGKWINFMNAGDEFYSFESCALVNKMLIEQDADVLYGDFIAMNSRTGSERPVKAKPLESLFSGMTFCHQAAFIRRDLLILNPFNVEYKIVADYFQILSLYNSGYAFYYLPITISKAEIGGVSYSNFETRLEIMKAVHSIKPYSFHITKIALQIPVDLFKKILGPRLTDFVRELKWRVQK